jgi:hypothetical protein
MLIVTIVRKGKKGRLVNEKLTKLALVLARAASRLRHRHLAKLSKSQLCEFRWICDI